MRVTTDNIFTVLSKLADEKKGKKISWGQMKESINQAGMKVANWMTVRGVLQFMLNEGILKRTEDVHVEEYEVLV